MCGLAFRERPAEDEVGRLLRLRRRRDDERPVALQLPEPAFEVRRRVVNRPVSDVGISAQERAAEFGDQFLLAVGIGAVAIPLGDARPFQPFLVAGRMDQFVE